MKIRDLSIDGFGVWSDLRLGGLADGINVFYGPNEAGKTTVMQFLRAMLYGFSTDRRQRYLPPVHGGRPGGEVTVTSAEGGFTVRRHAVQESTVGRLEFVADGELLRDDRLLVRLLGNVDEAVFRNVFAIGLREIQELGSLSDTEASQWLYKLATGADRVSLVDVLGELTKARTRLLAAGDSPSTIPQLLAERDRLRREVQEQSSVNQYIDLGRKRRDLSAQIGDWENEAATSERAARLLEVAAAVYEKWHARARVESDLASARGVPRLEPKTLEEFEALENSIVHGKKRGKAVSRRIGQNDHAIETLGLNEAVRRRVTRIEAILEQEQWITALDAERAALADKIHSMEARRTELCTRLGFDPALTASEPGAGMGKAWRQLKPLADELRAARQLLAEASAEVEQRQAGAKSTSQELASALKARGADNLTPLMERSGQLVSQLRRRVQLDERLTDLSRRKTELEARSRELLATALLPGWALVALGVAFVAGAVATLAGVFLPASVVGESGYWVASLGLVGAGGAAATKVFLEKAFERRSSTCLAQIETLAEQIEQFTQERDELDEQLPRGGGPLLARLQAAEKEQAAIEALLPLDSQRKAAALDAGNAEKRRAEAHDIYTQLRHRWRHALIDAGLSPKTPPGRAGQLARIRKYLARFDARLTDERAEWAHRQSVVEAFANRLTQLRAELDAPAEDEDIAPAPTLTSATKPQPATAAAARPKGSEVGDVLRLLREQLREQTALAARRRSLVRRGKALRERRLKVRGRLNRLRRKLEALLDREGAADALELRRRARESARGDQLADQRDTVTLEIAGLVGPLVDEEDVAALVSKRSREQLDQQWLDESTRARQLRDQVKSAHEQLGRWQQESSALVADRRASQTRLRLGAIEQQLREAAERWRVLAAAEWFLAGVRKRYERERQPETLREASGYLDRLTEGRYRRVWTPLDQDVLRVDDAEGQSLPIEVLSRGTREQLFLSLRLALVRWYARRGIELPLVLDDVLVNFDARRARAAAILLQEFAERGHQLLVFTCHEHMYQLFRSLNVPSRELPANPRVAAFIGPPTAELEVPHVPIVMPSMPVTARPQAVEIVEPPPLPTNGHRAEAHRVVEPAVAVPAPVPKIERAPQRKASARAHVKFDCLHGPRGPFATAMWHERVTYEVSGEPGIDEPHDVEDEWTDIDSVG